MYNDNKKKKLTFKEILFWIIASIVSLAIGIGLLFLFMYVFFDTTVDITKGFLN